LLITVEDFRNGMLFIHGNKDHIEYQIPVISYLETSLEKHIAQQESRRKGKSAPLFTAEDSFRPLSPRQVNSRFEKWKRLTGLPECLTVHSFRAGVANLLYRATGDFLMVSKFLGHQDINTTKRYVESTVSRTGQIIEKSFSEFFS